ncbi:MAG: response regulator transcription factor [Anaerolineae bacterium]|jgi:DNA-binding NarL/FixJ family response regulator|nr:response regulator transcription factor [Anaerolineae bacterium]
MTSCTVDPLRILIVDDNAIVRAGLRALIDGKADMTVVGEAADGAEAIAQARILKPDIILMDLLMPKMDGISATANICRQNPAARILMLSQLAEEERIFAARQAGALGYLVKGMPPERVVADIRSAARSKKTRQRA